MKVYLLIMVILSYARIPETRSQDLFPARSLTSDPAPEAFATWSPDGKSIIFQHTDPDDRSGKNGLWRLSINGTRKTRVTAGLAEHPKWSPDGKMIVFDADTGSNIMVVPSKGGRGRKLLPDSISIRNGGLPCWSPDGATVAFVERKGNSLCTYNIHSGELKKLFASEGKLPIPGCWCSDGNSILVACMDLKTRESRIIKVPADGSPARKLECHRSTFYRHLALSPDGKMLIYTALEGRYLGLYIMAAEGGKSLPLAVSVSSHNEAPAWSPDGRKIVFTSTRAGNPDIWMMEMDLEYLRKKLGIITDDSDFFPI